VFLIRKYLARELSVSSVGSACCTLQWTGSSLVNLKIWPDCVVYQALWYYFQRFIETSRCDIFTAMTKWSAHFVVIWCFFRSEAFEFYSSDDGKERSVSVSPYYDFLTYLLFIEWNVHVFLLWRLEETPAQHISPQRASGKCSPRSGVVQPRCYLPPRVFG
jgi:hypothetical protein